jgi:alkylated DNA repair dioxygenase AlkB
MPCHVEDSPIELIAHQPILAVPVSSSSSTFRSAAHGRVARGKARCATGYRPETTMRGLFDDEMPSGFRYRDDFISIDAEKALAAEIAGVEFATFEMRGVAARRRVAFFGRSYDAAARSAPPLPPFLVPLREQVAEWASVDPHAFAMALINEYPPGAPIGWHRDAPQYGIVAGVSLLSACRMKLRPYLPSAARRTPGRRPRTATHEIALERRSAYLLTGDARNAYEHHIPAVPGLRYSITFRTLRS